MNRLPEVVKRRIVEHLACYYSPAEVVKLIHEEFDVVLTLRHVRAYDPSTFQFAGGPRWQGYHAQARKRFENETAEIPISHRAYRLRRLGQIHDRALESGALIVAMNALEQAAKEVGGLLTNQRQISGKVDHSLAVSQTIDEKRNELENAISEALARRAKVKLLTEH